ncbi:hypothetical protein LCGC14_1248450 [marine sediment metagenome]|uniref:Uncharacterized protein n=1 Tax=marine sediment metagenome TaxID=412755 RepID=A0A0F9LQS8_9ZZZZ
MSLKSKLDDLTVKERRRLMHAFEMHISQYVQLPDNYFVGVNITTSSFKIIEQTGAWSYGKINLTGDNK